MSVDPPSLKIFTDAEWKEQYPAEEYKKRPITTRVQRLALHFLLALNQSDKAVLGYINARKGKTPSCLTAPDQENHGLTPLMIATMKGRVTVVKALLDFWKETRTLQKNIQPFDSHGWTVLHHAAISSGDIFKLLCEFGASQMAKTRLNGTPEDLRALTSRRVVNISWNTVFYQGDDKTLTPISTLAQPKLKELTGLAEYRDIPFVPQESLQALWRDQPQEVTPTEELLYKLCSAAASQTPPKLLLAKCKELEGKTAFPLGLFAGEKIPPGTLIGEYSGEMNPGVAEIDFFIRHFEPGSYDSTYLFGSIDAKNMGNATRWINWGWPNCIMPGLDIKGTHKALCIACDPQGIEEGEPLLFDYGLKESRLAFGEPQILFGRDKMRAFFKKGLQACLREANQRMAMVTMPAVQSGVLNKEIYAQEFINSSRLLFPLNVPGALLDLHFSGLVPASEWFFHLMYKTADTPLCVTKWIEDFSFEATKVRSLILRIMEIEISLNKVNTNLREKAVRWVLQNIGEISVMKILKGLEIIASRIEEDEAPTDDRSWKAFEEDLNTHLATYDWLKDEFAPLGRKRTREDKLTIAEFQFEDKEKRVDNLKGQQQSHLAHGYSKNSESYQDLVWMLEQLQNV